MAEAARNPRVAQVVREADATERELAVKLLEQVRPEGRSDAETAARVEVLMMLFDGLAIRAVNNPEGDRAAIDAVMRSVIRHLVSDAPLLDADAKAV
jgi:hypothetical protein